MLFTLIEDYKKRGKMERLYKAYAKDMLHVAYTILKDRQLSEDAVHESFIRIFNNLHKIDEDNCPRTRHFLVVICSNVAKDIYNKKLYLNNSNEQSEDLLADEDSNPVDVLITRESVHIIAKIIKELDPIYRDVLLLKRAEGYSREEIAQELGISIETVKKRLTRGKAMIIEKLKREESK